MPAIASPRPLAVPCRAARKPRLESIAPRAPMNPNTKILTQDRTKPQIANWLNGSRVGVVGGTGNVRSAAEFGGSCDGWGALSSGCNGGTYSVILRWKPSAQYRIRHYRDHFISDPHRSATYRHQTSSEAAAFRLTFGTRKSDGYREIFHCAPGGGVDALVGLERYPVADAQRRRSSAKADTESWSSSCVKRERSQVNRDRAVGVVDPQRDLSTGLRKALKQSQLPGRSNASESFDRRSPRITNSL